MVQQQQPPADKLKKLHQLMINEKYDVPTDYDVFARNLADEGKAKKIHGLLVSEKYDVPTDYDVFARNLAIGSYASSKKKDDTALSAGQSTTSSPQSPEAEPLQLSPEQVQALSKVNVQPQQVTPEQYAQVFNEILTAGKEAKGAGFFDELAPIPSQKRADQLKSRERLKNALSQLEQITDQQGLTEELKKQDNRAASTMVNPEAAKAPNDPIEAGVNVANQVGGAFNRALVQGVASIPKAVAIGGKEIDKFFGLKQGEKPVDEYPTYQLGQWLEDKALQAGITATDPDKESDFWQSTVPSAFGSVAAIILTGGRGGLGSSGAKGIQKAITTPGAAIGQRVKDAVNALRTPAAAAGGAAMAVPEYEQAIQAGMNEDEAFNVFLKNYIVGQTEVIPLQRALSQINKISGGAIIQTIKNGVVGGLEEATQEAVQTYLTNKIAQGSYDPERDSFRDILDATGAGFFVGFILPGIAGAMNKMTSEQKSDTQKVLNNAFQQIKQQKDAIQEQSPAEVSVQPEATVSQEVVEGESQPELQDTTGTPAPEEAGPGETKTEVLEEAEPVKEFVETNRIPPEETVSEKEKLIAEHLTRFPTESFNRFGDPNFVKDTPVMRMMYLSKKGTPIDVQARDMSLILNPEGDGTEITTQDIVDFVQRFPKGKKEFYKLSDEEIKPIAEEYVPDVQNNLNVMRTLEIIDKEGITKDNFDEKAQELLKETFWFTDEHINDIKAIFEYEQTEEGSRTIADIRAKKGQGFAPVGEGTGEGSRIPEVQSSKKPEDSGPVIGPKGYPVDWGAPPKKKKKATISSTEKKLQKVSTKIKKGTATEADVTRAKNLNERRNKLMSKRYEGEQASTEKFYQPPIGSPKRKGRKAGTRISVSPIYGGKRKLLKDIILDLSKKIPSKLFYTKSPIKGRRAIGSYSPSNAAIAIKYKGDLDVTAHELGHSLDDRYGLLEAIPQTQQKAIEKELRSLSQFGSNPPKGHPNPKAYRIGEGMAEYIRAYLVNPDEAKVQFPETSIWFEQVVPEEVRNNINEFGTDIRNFAGLSAHDQIMSNVQFEPEKKQGGLASFFKPFAASKDNFELTWLDRLGQKFTNDKRAFEKAVSYLEDAQGVKLNPANDPRMLARVFLGSNEKFENILKEGLVNSKNQRVKDKHTNSRMTFEWLLQPFDNADVATIKKEQQEAISYMIADRTVELAGRFERSSIISGIGAGIFTDVEVAIKRLDEFNQLPKEKKDRIIEATRRYREYADRVLRYMKDKGRISEDQYNQIKQDNIQYVAMQRILEAAPGEDIVVYKNSSSGKVVGNVKKVVHRIKGSSALINNPYESLIDTAVKSVREADRNEVMLAFRDLFRKSRAMHQGKPIDTGQIARLATSGDKNTIQIFVDGKGEYWQLQPDVYEAVKNITDLGYKLPGVVTALPRLLRWSVTNFPVFAIRNRIRDIQQRFIVSDTKAFKGYDIYRDKKTKNLTKDLFQLFGGGQAGYYLLNDDFYYKKMDETIRDIAKEKNTILTIPSKLGDAYGNLINRGERATRLEEYRSAFKFAKSKGMDDYNASIYAAYKARDLLDFSVAGEWMRVVNQVIPFSNAAVQGLRKTIRSASADPGGFALRFTLFAVIPAILTRLLIHDQDKDEEYADMPAYRRDLYYNIPMGPDMWLTIPKPFELGVLSTGIERMFSKYALDEKGALDGYHLSLLRSVTPVDDAALAGPARTLVEVTTNYDFFRDKNIIPPDQVGLKLEYRDTSKASNLGKAIQEVVGVDARQADYVIKGTTSYFGDLSMRLSDIGRDDTRYPINWALTGLIKNDPLYESKSVQKVFDFVKENGIHWSDPFYQDLNAMISTYFEASDPNERNEIGNEVRDFAKKVLEIYENDEYYRRENQVLEE